MSQVEVKKSEKVVHGNGEKEESVNVIRGLKVATASSVLGIMKVKRGRRFYRYGRLYIPLEYLEKIGISEDDLKKGVEVDLEILTNGDQPLIIIKPRVTAAQAH